MRKIISCLPLLLVGLMALPAYADTFRCAGRIVEDGMAREKVLELCGPPNEQNHQTVDSWTYTRGSGEMDVVVYFYANGNVEKIDSVSGE